MPPPEGRSSHICVYIISFLLFVSIVAGGAFFVLYIILPESEHTIWFPIAGAVLVGMPWLFWTTTCLYRTITRRQTSASGGSDRTPGRVASAVTPAAVDDPPVNSPGGRGRVRFGAATVMDGPQEAPEGEGGAHGGGCSSDTESRTAEGSEGGSHATYRSSATQEDGSLASHDSEMPMIRAS